MKYYVSLIQRGISAQSHPVSGKSGTLYGQATASPKDGGVAFRMELEEYTKNAHDIVGNTAPAQQWVPVFNPEASSTVVSHKCGIPAGCRNPATHVWDQYFYCGKHAPVNATPLDGSAEPVMPSPVQMPEPAPVLIQEAPGIVEKDVNIAPEHMPPPAVGSEDVVSDTSHSDPVDPPLPKQFLRQPPSDSPESHKTPPPVEAPPVGAAPAPKGSSAVEVLVETVTDRVVGKLAPLLERLEQKISGPPAWMEDPPRPKLTEYQQLQQKAKELGMEKVVGKSKAELQKFIAFPTGATGAKAETAAVGTS